MKKFAVFAAVFGLALTVGAAQSDGELLTGKWLAGKGVAATVEKTGVQFKRTEGSGAWIATSRFKPETGATYRLEVELKEVPEKAKVKVFVRYNKERIVFVPAENADGVLAVNEPFTVSEACKFVQISVWCSRTAEGETLELGKCSVKKVKGK